MYSFLGYLIPVKTENVTNKSFSSENGNSMFKALNFGVNRFKVYLARNFHFAFFFNDESTNLTIYITKHITGQNNNKLNE